MGIVVMARMGTGTATALVLPAKTTVVKTQLKNGVMILDVVQRIIQIMYLRSSKHQTAMWQNVTQTVPNLVAVPGATVALVQMPMVTPTALVQAVLTTEDGNILVNYIMRDLGTDGAGHAHCTCSTCVDFRRYY